jgi:hypothetical protein
LPPPAAGPLSADPRPAPPGQPGADDRSATKRIAGHLLATAAAVVFLALFHDIYPTLTL